MARTRGHGEPFPWRALTGPLSEGDRSRVATGARALLDWQHTLRRWPDLPSVPDATPFVSLYTEGRLTGCFGSMEGAPGERLARAFIRALEDGRHGGVGPDERASLTASVAYPRAPHRVSLRELEEQLELGTHGVAVIGPGREPTLLLPTVATDEGLDVMGLVHTLARKARMTLAELGQSTLYTFEADVVVVRSPPVKPPRSRRERRDAVSRVAGVSDLAAVDAAARFLARRVDSQGRVGFGVDARARKAHDEGEFLHGRAAAVIQALAAHGRHPGEVRRARRWLDGEIRAGLSGRATAGWPEDPAGVAGTVALAVLAGLDLVSELQSMATLEPVRRNPWHAAQVVVALGARAPQALFRACVSNLAEQPWAPWTALAAQAIGDPRVARRATDALARSIRSAPPHVGASDVTRVPEVALTALAVEALARSRSSSAQAAAARAVSFLRSVQLLGERIPASLDAPMAEGAFPLSVTALGLRADVTAHAVLALLAAHAARA